MKRKNSTIFTDFERLNVSDYLPTFKKATTRGQNVFLTITKNGVNLSIAGSRIFEFANVSDNVKNSHINILINKVTNQLAIVPTSPRFANARIDFYCYTRVSRIAGAAFNKILLRILKENKFKGSFRINGKIAEDGKSLIFDLNTLSDAQRGVKNINGKV